MGVGESMLWKHQGMLSSYKHGSHEQVVAYTVMSMIKDHSNMLHSCKCLDCNPQGAQANEICQ